MLALSAAESAAGWRIHPNGRVKLPPPKSALDAARYCYRMGSRDPDSVGAMYRAQHARIEKDLAKARALIGTGRKFQGMPADAAARWLEESAALHAGYAAEVPAALARIIEQGGE